MNDILGMFPYQYIDEAIYLSKLISRWNEEDSLESMYSSLHQHFFHFPHFRVMPEQRIRDGLITNYILAQYSDVYFSCEFPKVPLGFWKNYHTLLTNIKLLTDLNPLEGDAAFAEDIY